MMVCTFGVNSHDILSKAVNLGCNVRLGFEYGFFLPDGNMAKTNDALIIKNIKKFKQSGRTIANINQTRILLGQSV